MQFLFSKWISWRNIDFGVDGAWGGCVGIYEDEEQRMTERTLVRLCERINWQFEDVDLLRLALRHSSFSHEHPAFGDHNQRLEFLGDAVVGLVVAEALFLQYPNAREGQLTRWRAELVSEKPLAAAASSLELGDLIELGRGEDVGGGRLRPSLLSDAFEALVGASFLDGGLDAARAVVNQTLGERIAAICAESTTDHKSKLQERVQATGAITPSYKVVDATGPDHDKKFEVHLTIADELYGAGVGSSKKIAEQSAARQALARLDEESSA